MTVHISHKVIADYLLEQAAELVSAANKLIAAAASDPEETP